MKKLSYIFETAAFLSPTELDSPELTNHNYHYYMIVTSPIQYIKDCYEKDGLMAFLLTDGEQEIEIVPPKAEGNYVIKNITYRFTDPSHTSIMAKYSCIFEDGRICKGEAEFGGKAIYCRFAPQKNLRIEYIGQSYANDGHRTSQDRLSSHSTLQKILADYSCTSTKRDVELLLLGADISIIENINVGNNGVPFVTIDGNESQDYVNLLEAFLINFFKPKYNDKFVNGIVPSSAHTSYQEVLKENFDDFSINVAIYGSVNNYRLFTTSNSIEINQGILNQNNRIYYSFKDANKIDPDKYYYSFT